MTRVRSWRMVACAIGVLATVLPGCGPRTRPAMLLDSGFQPQSVAEITILPAVDARIDKANDVNLESQIREASAKILEGRGYVVALGTSRGELIEEDLRAPDAEWIKHLGSPKARWVMVVSLLDVTSKITFGSTGNAEVAGYLFDTEEGTLVWRDKGIGQVGQGGLLGMAMVAAMDDAAISAALGQLFTSIPPREEN